MKSTHVSIASLVLALTCATALPAYAHMHEPKGDCAQGQMPEMMQKRMMQRQATLKTELKLTPEQEPAWESFVQSMKPSAQVARPNPAELDAMTTLQRLEKMKAMRAERDAHMNQRMQAVQTFYNVLTPEQQKVFDAHKPMNPHQRHQGRGMHG
jgi:Spy/CpxP family protein refolding chaperone